MTSGNTLHRSQDSGNSWSVVLNNSNGIEDIKAGPFDNLIYYLSNATLYAYLPQVGQVQIRPSIFYFDIAPNGDIYTYSGGGAIGRRNHIDQQWSNLFNQSDDPKGIVTFGNNRNFYWTDDLGTYRFADNGSFRDMVIIGSATEDRTMAESADKRLWMTSGGGLRISDNDGTNWTSYSNSAFQGVTVYGIYNAPGGGILYAVSSKGLWRSEDNGVNWVLLAQFPLSNFEWQHGQADMKTGKNNELFICNGLCAKQFFLHSLDGGLNWEPLEGLFNTSLTIKVDKDQEGNLYALSCSGKLSKSVDEGFTWQYLQVTGPFSDLEDIHVSPDGNIYAVDDTLVYRSADAGLSWESFPSPLNIQPPAPERYLVRTGGKGELFCYDQAENYRVYCSLDKGATWQGTNGAAFYRNWLHQHPDGTIFLNTFDNNISKVGISFSSDGLQWTPINFGNAFTDPQIVKILPDGTIYFTANTIGYRLFRTDTKFADWIMTGGTVTNNYMGMVIDNNHVMYRMGGTSPVLRSVNDGLTWSSTGVNSGLSNTPGSDYRQTLYLTNDQYLYYCSALPKPVYRSISTVADFDNLTGSIYSDEDQNCLPTTVEPQLRNWIVSAERDNQVYFGSVFPDARYHLAVPTPGQYSIQAVAPHAMWSVCGDPVLTHLQNTSDRDTIDFAAKVATDCVYLEIQATTPRLRRCFDNTYTVAYFNRGTAAAQNVTVSIKPDSFFVYQNASVPVDAQNGNELLFNIGSLPAGAYGFFQITFNVSCAAALGQMHCIEAEIAPHDPCLAGFDTLFTVRECRSNSGSFDPNNVLAFIGGMEREADLIYQTEPEIQYQINFQNTGTDTAFRVLIVDSLSSYLIPESITPEISSHPYKFDLLTNPRTGKHFIRVLFYPVYLPDSTTNEPGSHGFIRFKIRRQSGLAPGTDIRNMAAIYFDYNKPILTNNKSLVLTEITSVSSQANNLPRISVFPNPAGDGRIQIRANERILQVSAWNFAGQQVFYKDFSDSGLTAVQIEAAEMHTSSSIIFLEIRTEYGREVLKLLRL